MLKIIKIIGSIRYNIKSAGLFQSTGLLLAGLGLIVLIFKPKKKGRRRY